MTIQTNSGRKAGQQKRSQNRRKAIIKAATKLFTEQGFSSVTLDDVAVAAQSSKQTIYRQFGNRDGLQTEVITAVVDQLVVPIQTAITSTPPGTEQLNQLAKAYQEMVFAPTSIRLSQFLIGAVPTNAFLGSTFNEFVIDRVTSLVEPIIARSVGAHSAAVETDRFLGSLQGKEYNRVLAGQPPDWQRLTALRQLAVATVMRT